MKCWAVCTVALSALAIVITTAQAQRQQESLDRGLVAINQGNAIGVFLSWRLLGGESQDLGFNVYRQTAGEQPIRLNDQPLTAGTNFVDSKADLTEATSYSIRDVNRGIEGQPCKPFTFEANPPQRDYLCIPLQVPAGYYAGDTSIGDLDGDGTLEFVIHATGRGRDNSQSGFTDQPILQAYNLDGSLLWSINLGRNIREGAHYTQFMVYDLDGDGRAEIVCKTADGTIDGLDKVIGDPDTDNRSQPGGYILKGPEYLTVFDGQTGGALATVNYVPQRHPETDSPTPEQMNAVWGDSYGNRIDRFLGCVAFLDGQRPSIVMSRGYYTRTVLAAWDWRDGKLTQRWVFDSDKVGPANDRNSWRGQGNHSIAVADVDDDGKDEIIFGAMVIDDDGTGLYSTRLGHGDAQHTGDLDPNRPGLEIWSIHEHPPNDRAGVELRNARTGEIYFAAAHGVDVGRGMAADIDPRFPGSEVWGGTGSLLNVNGERIGPQPRSQNMAIWWDGDFLRELLDGVSIYKWEYEHGTQSTLFDGRALGLASNNGSKSNPCLAGDILGDWREELVARTADNRELRIYTTTIPTDHRLTTLLHDSQYRLSIAWQNVGYNQPPHPSFFLGEGMVPK